MNKHFLFPAALFLVFTIIIFYKFFFFHLQPIPTNLLVSFFFPWNSGGWEGFNSFTTHKEFIGADAIRQHLPWLKFSFDEIKSGHLPVWDPYSFSGTPNIANIQRFIFYPLNFIFLLFPMQIAWSILIISQVFLGQVFMFLFLKKLTISSLPAVLASLAFVSSTYFIYNLEINIIGHTLIWLPLLLYSLECLTETFKFRYFILSTFCFTAIFLAGHPQTAILVSLLFIFYVIYKYSIFKKFTIIALGTASVLSGLAVSSFVALPSIYLFIHAPLRGAHPDFEYYLIPFKNLLTLFAPDLYGNPATNNFFSRLYGDGTPHVGSIIFFFAILSLFYIKDLNVKFFAFVSSFFILISLSTPVAHFIKALTIPVFSSSNMSRNSSVALFALCVLGALGLQNYLKDRKASKKLILVAILFTAIYAALWFFGVFSPKIDINNIPSEQSKIIFRNLIIPTSIFFLFLISAMVFKQKKIFSALIILFSFFGFFYSFNKTLPFSKKEFFFPKHPIIEFINKKASINRFYGQGTAHLGTNFSSYYHIHSPEGYSLLRSKRYAELVAASHTGSFNSNYSRSDAEFPKEENGYRKRALDLLGVKYFLDKTDLEDKQWNPEPNKFPRDNVKLVWQDGKFKVYERENSMPRIFLTDNYVILKESEIINKIYNEDFDLKTILLEKPPPLEITKSNYFSTPYVELYSPSKVIVSTSHDQNSLLFISDAYYPRWKAQIDGRETEVLIADYALRAVAVPSGNHKVILSYESILFPFGLFISVSSITILSLVSLYSVRKKRF